MSTQQGSYNTYIGARYVPIFDGQWDNTKAFEPLVIVEYQGNSYTSKTYVPIGIDINNTDYWALTGNYNAQVEAYRKEVSDYLVKVNTNAENINLIKSKDTIVIGDSYGFSENSWIDKLKLYRPDFNIISNATGGSGFNVQGFPTFLQLITNLAPQITNPEKITRIIVCGGYNDSDSVHGNTSTLEMAISNFISYCKSTYINADIYIGEIGWTLNANIFVTIPAVINAYMNCVKYGAYYLYQSNFIMHYDKLFNDDGIHPNEDGQEKIAIAISNSLRGNYVTTNLFANSEYTADNSDLSTNTFSVGTCLTSGIITGTINYQTGSSQLVFSSPQNIVSNETIKIGTITNTYLFGDPYGTASIIVPCVFGFADGSPLKSTFINVIFKNREVYLRFNENLTNLNGIVINSSSFALPAIED